MASIYKRKDGKGWRAIIRMKGYPTNRYMATLAAGQGASNVELATAMGHSTLSQLLRYSNLDAKNSKKFSDHISERILKGSAHE